MLCKEIFFFPWKFILLFTFENCCLFLPKTFWGHWKMKLNYWKRIFGIKIKIVLHNIWVWWIWILFGWKCWGVYVCCGHKKCRFVGKLDITYYTLYNILVMGWALLIYNRLSPMKYFSRASHMVSIFYIRCKMLKVDHIQSFK